VAATLKSPLSTNRAFLGLVTYILPWHIRTMKKPKTTEVVRYTRGDKFWLAKISEAKDFLGQETNAKKAARRSSNVATEWAFDLGKLLQEIPNAYGEKVIPNFSKDSQIPVGTLWDRLYLYRGCVDRGHIKRFHTLNRNYYKALGSIINGFFPKKVIGGGHSMLDRYIHGMLLANPLLIEKEGEESEPDVQALTEAGRLLSHFHKVVGQSKTLSLVLSLCELEWIPSKNGGNFGLNFPQCSQPWHKGAINRFIGEFHRLLHNIFLVGDMEFEMVAEDGVSLPKVKLFARKKHKPGAAEIIHHDDRDRLTQWVTSIPPADCGDAAKLVLDECQIVLKDNSFLIPRSVDLVLTDPPYSDEAYAFGWRAHNKVKHSALAKAEDAGRLVGTVANLLVRNAILKEKFIWFNFFPTDYAHFFVKPVLDAFQGNGLDIIWQVLTWNKVNGVKVGGHRYFRRDCESILYVNVGNRPLSSTLGGRPCYLHSTLFTCPHEKGRAFEKRGYWKPIKLLEKLIRLATYDSNNARSQKQVVLDPFAGSGSTAVAAINCHRDYRLIECDNDQFTLATANVDAALRRNRRG
jgi:site-specific DNA-methyltransferase (adenine-specific)